MGLWPGGNVQRFGDYPDQHLRVVGVAGGPHLDLGGAAVPDHFQLGKHRGVEFRGLCGQLVEVVTGAGQNPGHVGVALRRVRQSVHRAQRLCAGHLLTDRQHHVTSAQPA